MRALFYFLSDCRTSIPCYRIVFTTVARSPNSYKRFTPVGKKTASSATTATKQLQKVVRASKLEKTKKVCIDPRTCYDLTRTCHNLTRTCHNLTRTCHNLIRTLTQLNPNLSQLIPDLSQLNPELSQPNPNLSQLNPNLLQLNPKSSGHYVTVSGFREDDEVIRGIILIFL